MTDSLTSFHLVWSLSKTKAFLQADGGTIFDILKYIEYRQKQTNRMTNEQITCKKYVY